MKSTVFLVAVIAGLVAFSVRLPGVGQFMTVDEQNWMVRTGDFMKSLARGDIEGTFQGTHPGATAMWLMGSGITMQEWRLDAKLTSKNLELFHKAAVMPMVVATSFLIALVTGLLVVLIDWPAALVAGLLIASEPYLAGMSQIAHLDALQSMLMLTAILSFACYLTFNQRRFIYLTGVTLGLALGTKTLLALWLPPCFIVMIMLDAWWRRQRKFLWLFGRSLIGVIVIALAVFIMVWPAIVTKTDLQLGYISRDAATIVTDEHGVYEGANNPIDMRTFYARTVLGRTTPYVQILALGALMLIIGRAVQLQGRLATKDRLLLYLGLYTIGYLLLITFAAKKADRYALPALAVWPVLGGLFIAQIWPSIERHLVQLRRWRKVLLAAGAIGIISQPFLWSPYVIAYSNPFFPNIRPLTQQGWGEGLEEAAAWLNQQPQADNMYIASWYPSVMRTYFKGIALSLSSRHDYRVQYLVTYRNMGGRAGDDQASDVLDELRNQQPVKTIYIKSVPYVWIYETNSVGNITKTVGEITGSKEIGQTVRPSRQVWQTIDIGFATFSKRNNTEDVILHVRQSPIDLADLRTVRVRANALQDNQWHRFDFDSLDASAGQEFYIFIDSPTSIAGNAVTVRYTELDIRPGQMYVNGQVKPGDIAYRIQD